MRLWQIYHGQIPAFLQEAAQTPVMRRLQGVGMNCGCEYTAFPLFAGWQPYSRWEHSMGAALIVWHFTQDPVQAMAALLHDVATPVFSHVVDFLYGDHQRQEHTEAGTAERILGSEALLQVLDRYGIDPEAVTDYHRYPIADNDAPRLSADRLEYTLGNIVNFGFGDRLQVKALYEDLESTSTELVFRNEHRAAMFARLALRCSRVYVSDADRFSMQYLADLLGEAMKLGVLEMTDLHARERDVIEKLTQSPLKDRWQAFCRLEKLGKDPTGRVILGKKRYIDPMTAGGKRVSELDAAFAAELSSYLAQDFRYGLIEMN